MPGQHAPTRSLENPNQEFERLRVLVVEQATLIEQLHERIHELEERIQTLETRLAQDSHNSSQPPSSDPPFKKPPPAHSGNRADAGREAKRVGAGSLGVWSRTPTSASSSR